MKFTPLFLILLLCFKVQAADKLSADQLAKIADSLKAEGLMLYNSEHCSWIASDLFMSSYTGNQDDIGGYCSYIDGSGMKCIFTSKPYPDSVIGTVIFKDGIDPETGIVNLQHRMLTATEQQYVSMRRTVQQMTNASDGFFKYYDNCNFNIAPLITGDYRRVYVITSTAKEGVILYGNDYKITLDKDNKVIDKKALHRTLLPINPKEDTVENLKGTIHTHISEYNLFITPTDICTSMLYMPPGSGNSCVTISKDYISIWNCDAATLVIVPNPGKKKE